MHEIANSGQRDAGTLICTVCATANVLYLKRLLEYGLSANSGDYDGRTGLHLAASTGQTSMVECLLVYGADPNRLVSKRKQAGSCSQSPPKSHQTNNVIYTYI